MDEPPKVAQNLENALEISSLVLYVDPVSMFRALALDTPVARRQLYTDHPTPAPSPKGQEIPTLLCRRLQ